ncbi:primosomal protein DnaI [Thomasclavelia sp.]|uniref:primosomal protein DnaI n=1 Tax=Thomasclavelia sp. TaxID=3025757 RepID=UPI0025EFF015|nr:primosomal protein DnaI [Thomasclavelia sp.]
MKDVQSVNLFINDESFRKNKENSINELLSDHNIIKVLKQYNLTREDIEENWIEFLDYQEDLNYCKGCRSLKSCPKISKGMVRCFNYENEQITLSLQPCVYGKAYYADQKIISSILLKNVSDRILLTKPSDLTIKNDPESNGKAVIKILSDYIKKPQTKGIYLFGTGGSGKSTLMGFLIRCLVTGGNKCGFIHFPTFLMDIKASFGNEGVNNSIELMKNLDYLVIDDVGGENVTSWSRDEILSAVIAYRLQNQKTTFFTSEYSFEKLKKIYMLKAGDKENVERLISRMKAISMPVELKGRDLR